MMQASLPRHCRNEIAKGPTRQVAIVVRQTEMNVAYAFSRDESLARKAVDEATLAGKVVRR